MVLSRSQRERLVRRESDRVVRSVRSRGVLGDYTARQLRSMGIITLSAYLRQFSPSERRRRTWIWKNSSVESMLPDSGEEKKCYVKDRAKWMAAMRSGIRKRSPRRSGQRR
jgi:hypothetical protein